MCYIACDWCKMKLNGSDWSETTTTYWRVPDGYIYYYHDTQLCIKRWVKLQIIQTFWSIHRLCRHMPTIDDLLRRVLILSDLVPNWNSLICHATGPDPFSSYCMSFSERYICVYANFYSFCFACRYCWLVPYSSSSGRVLVYSNQWSVLSGEFIHWLHCLLQPSCWDHWF